MINFSRSRLRAKKVIFIVAVLAALAVVGVYGKQYWDDYSSTQREKEATREQAENLVKDEPGESDASQAIDYGTAGSLYSDNGEYQKALDSLLKAQAICDKETEPSIACNPGYNELIGDTYQQLGDNGKAKTYWQKAIADYKRLSTPDLTYEEDIKRVEAK